MRFTKENVHVFTRDEYEQNVGTKIGHPHHVYVVGFLDDLVIAFVIPRSTDAFHRLEVFALDLAAEVERLNRRPNGKWGSGLVTSMDYVGRTMTISWPDDDEPDVRVGENIDLLASGEREASDDEVH